MLTSKTEISYINFTSFVSKIISGGQTGADRGGLDAAIELEIPYGGWCPKGRLSEDGVIPNKYKLNEMPSKDYLKRTEQNVIDAEEVARGINLNGNLYSCEPTSSWVPEFWDSG